MLLVKVLQQPILEFEGEIQAGVNFGSNKAGGDDDGLSCCCAC